MPWITPKTDWLSSDYINKEDFNRIRNNLLYLYDESKKYYKYELSRAIQDEATYSTYAYTELWNFIEFTLNDISSNTYMFDDIGEMKEFLPYDLYIDYKELNRIETATLKYYQMFIGLKNTIPTLSFTLGDYNGVKV